MTDTKKFNGLLIAGDFNHPDLQWSNDGGTTKLNRHASANDFLELLNANFIIQNVLVPTFGANTLDLVLTEHPNRIFTITNGPSISSSEQDHLHLSLAWDYELSDQVKQPKHNRANNYNI